MERACYIQRAAAAVTILNAESPSPRGGCSRLSTAVFLGEVLPAMGAWSSYEISEWEAGLRWVYLKRPFGFEQSTLEELLVQTEFPVEGIMVETQLKDSDSEHKFVILRDDESLQGEGVLLVDALDQPERFRVYPDIGELYTYLQRMYKLEPLITSVKIIVPSGRVLPPVTRMQPNSNNMGEWQISDTIRLQGQFK